MTPDNANEAIGEDEPTDTQLSEVFGAKAGLVREYHDLLATTGLQWGLLGPREAERLWCRHILNSAAIAPLVPERASVLDVGSGAGLPGIPLALARPDLQVTLLDSLLRRAKFLQLAVDSLGLGDRVTVVRARAEETSVIHDVVVSRAVAPLAKLVQWCEPLMRSYLVALKGETAQAEVADAGAVLQRRKLYAQLVTLETVAGCESATAVMVTRR